MELTLRSIYIFGHPVAVQQVIQAWSTRRKEAWEEGTRRKVMLSNLSFLDYASYLVQSLEYHMSTYLVAAKQEGSEE